MSQTQTILLVEDDSGLRELLQEELEAEGYQVTACGDAEQGLALLNSQTPDLLISDLRLPGADGLSLLPNLTHTDSAPAVLIITAFGSVQQAVKALQAANSEVVVAASADATHLYIRISDDGPGLAPEFSLATLLEPFFTTKSPGEGTGLGLAIVQTVSDEHNAQLSFKNRAQGGCEVCLTLPLSDNSRDASA